MTVVARMLIRKRPWSLLVGNAHAINVVISAEPAAKSADITHNTCFNTS